MVYQVPGGLLTPGEAQLLPAEDPDAALRRHMRFGLILVTALVLILLVLAAVVRISGAVIGPGDVTVATKIKRIAHPTGGVIAEVYVRDGDRVRAGQPLMRLDSTVSSVSAEVTGESFDQLLADKARLTAERDGAAAIVFPRELLTRRDASARGAVAQAQRLFLLKRQSLAGQRAQLSERIRQQEQLIESYRRQIGANRQQVALIGPERENVRGLYEKQLVTTARLNQLERTAVDLEGSAASLEANIAQTRARITETRQQILQLASDLRATAGAELAEVTRKLSEQQVSKTDAGEQFRRSIIRAPSAGVIDKLAFTTVGGVVPQGQTIVEIVPDSDDLTVEARISPVDVDAIAVGQEAVVRFSAFSAATTPEVSGRLTRISAERAQDERTGFAFYTIEVAVEPAETKKLGRLKLVPGMPVEVFVRTADRSLLSYMVKPLRDQLSRSFRQD